MKDTLQIKTVCRVCGEEKIIEVKKEDYERYQNGELVQRAFPYLSPDAREMFISGICTDCWDKIFKGLDDEYFEEEELK